MLHHRTSIIIQQLRFLNWFVCFSLRIVRSLGVRPMEKCFFKQSVSFLGKQKNISFAVVFEVKSTANIYCSQLLIHLKFWCWRQYYSHLLIWLVSGLIWCATKKSVINFSPTNVREVFILTSKPWTSLQVVITKRWIWRGHWPEIDWNTLLTNLCILNMYVLINKSQLNCNVNSKVNFQKMRVLLFMLYSKFLCGRHTNTQLAVLRDFAEVCIEFSQSSLMGESTKKGRLNFWASLWKR